LSGNLRDRLRLIKQAKQSGGESRNRGAAPNGGRLLLFEQCGWVNAGYLTLRREIVCSEDIELPDVMPEAAGIVMPGLNSGTAYEDLLFYDLETTGLSGGAGTVAFLAAFGRLERSGKAGPKTALHRLRLTQYLLLDYPGESDFVAAQLGEFGRSAASGGVTMVSYNGRCFDSQILATRCLMNGVAPPEYRHADLLYPARRLWKRLLPSCSQGSVETLVFGIDRRGDIPGAMAPDIWFNFLKNGETEPLLGICDHNRRDIAGLAAIFSAMAGIADDPFAAIEKINVDLETLALHWYYVAKRGDWGVRLLETGKGLLSLAAERGGRRAALHYAFMLLNAGKHDEGREWLLRTAREDSPLPIQAAALRALAIDSERRLKNAAEALVFSRQALELLPADSSQRLDFEHRVERLERKITGNK